MARRIGFSLSGCVYDLIRGVDAQGEPCIKEDVVYILANTCYETEEQFQEVMAHYCKGIWRQYQVVAIEICRWLKDNDKIIQPRSLFPNSEGHHTMPRWLTFE